MIGTHVEVIMIKAQNQYWLKFFILKVLSVIEMSTVYNYNYVIRYYKTSV